MSFFILTYMTVRHIMLLWCEDKGNIYFGGEKMDKQYNNYAEAVSEILKCARQRRGYTIKQTAENAGVSENTVRRYENNLKDTRLETLQKICEALKWDFVGVLTTAHEMVYDCPEQEKEQP